MAVSTDFAPPFKLIAPYFVLGIIFYSISSFLLFGVDVSNISQLSSTSISFIHIFLLGFVMMTIFGAMAQLIPVSLEVGHFAVDLYYVIYPLLSSGTVLMGIGFLYSPILLPFGGTVVLISMFIFVFETSMTLIKVNKFTFIVKTVTFANIFLFIGLLFGILMALGYSGMIDIDMQKYLLAHIFSALLGYVGLTIMGMSLILLPMFWLSHSFSWKSAENSFLIMVFSVLSIIASVLLQSDYLKYIGYFLICVAICFYLYQINLIYKTRVRKENDIYFKSVLFSYSSLAVCLLLGVFYIIFQNESLVLVLGWLLCFGYIGFIITGHLYKIVPFLVWYQRFAPLIGKQKVPMLADMIPKKGANFQFYFSFLGVVICSFGIGFSNQDVFFSGVSFLSVGSIFMIKNLLYMMNFKN